jgi:SAM-dependent methyltransferase
MPYNQDETFAAFEGDRWFQRNRAALEAFNTETDLPVRLIELYQLQPRAVLEVGAANGARLAAIAERRGARVVAVELSVEAIRNGKSRFPRVEFVRGTASAIPVQELFDLVIVNFVFHWIDRSNLLRSVAEVDRLVVDGGFLIIGDFLPTNLTKVRYHHRPNNEIYTYKQNYAATFMACGIYRPVSLVTADHSSHALTADTTEEERVGAWLLRKSMQGRYVERPSPR